MKWIFYWQKYNSSLFKIQQNISYHLLHHFRLILNYVQGMLQSKKWIMNSLKANIAITYRSRNIFILSTQQFILKQKTHGIWRSPKYHSPLIYLSGSLVFAFKVQFRVLTLILDSSNSYFCFYILMFANISHCNHLHHLWIIFICLYCRFLRKRALGLRSPEYMYHSLYMNL